LEGTHEETSSEEDLGEKETTCLGFMAIGESDIDSESDSDNEVNLDLQEAFNELFEISKSLRVENKSIKKNLSFLRNENDRLEKQLKDIETSPKDNNLLLENQDLINENNKLIEENNSLKLEISDLKTKMDIIEKEIACLRENSNKLINKVDNFYSPKVEKGSPSRRPSNKSGSKLTWIPKKKLESCFVGFRDDYNIKDWTYKLKAGQLKLGEPMSRPRRRRRRPTRRRTNDGPAARRPPDWRPAPMPGPPSYGWEPHPMWHPPPPFGPFYWPW
jgi:regulator of replication initiation timing